MTKLEVGHRVTNKLLGPKITGTVFRLMPYMAYIREWNRTYCPNIDDSIIFPRVVVEYPLCGLGQAVFVKLDTPGKIYRPDEAIKYENIRIKEQFIHSDEIVEALCFPEADLELIPGENE